MTEYSSAKTGEYPRLLYLPTSSTKVGTIRRERLAQLLRGMFLTQTLLPTVLFGWSPPLKKQLTMPRCSVVDVVMNLNILSHHSSKLLTQHVQVHLTCVNSAKFRELKLSMGHCEQIRAKKIVVVLCPIWTKS